MELMEHVMSLYRLHNPIVTDEHDLMLLDVARDLMVTLGEAGFLSDDLPKDFDRKVKAGAFDFSQGAKKIMSVLIDHFPYPNDDQEHPQ